MSDNNKDVAIIETLIKPDKKKKITYTTFFGFSIAHFIAYMVGNILLLVGIAILGIAFHAWWSLTISVLAIAKSLKEVVTFGKTVEDISFALKDYGIENRNIIQYLSTNGTMTLRVVEKIDDEGAIGCGDPESQES